MGKLIRTVLRGPDSSNGVWLLDQALETKAKFIAQVMKGEATLRQIEDIGGAELSYAEVKAIASGNPAVLTLAETDVELKRLHVLQKHHNDEQYLAGVAVNKELPKKIKTFQEHIDALTQDMATTKRDTGITIGGKSYPEKELLEAVKAKLDMMPKVVDEPRDCQIGAYHGLTFGITLYPWHAPDMYVEGKALRVERLAKDAGPRAVLHAVERLMQSYGDEVAKTRRDRDIARGQLRDYEARLGAGFAHAGYLEELASLRNQLEAALSSPAQEAAAAPLPAVADLVARIKARKAAHTIEPAPERTAQRKAASMAEAVTTRILRRTRDAEPASAQPEQIALPVSPVAPEKTAEVVGFTTPVQPAGRPKNHYQHRVTQEQQQMRLL